MIFWVLPLKLRVMQRIFIFFFCCDRSRIRKSRRSVQGCGNFIELQTTLEVSGRLKRSNFVGFAVEL